MTATPKTLELWKTLVGSEAPDDTFRFKEASICAEGTNTYKLTWEKIGPTSNGVTDIQMRLKFDYGSFEMIFARLHPTVTITEYDVIWTIGYFFEDLGHKVIVFGRDHYEELAERIVESTGFRQLWEFGIR